MELYHDLADGFLFDLDGTVYLGTKPIDGASRVIRTLKDSGKKVCFLTNNSNTLRSVHAERLNSMGIPAEPHEIVTAAYATLKWIGANCSNCRIFIVGEDMLLRKFESEGFKLTEDPAEAEIVLSSFDRTFSYDKLWKALTAMRSGARLIATNPDKACPVDGTFLPDCASITAAIEAASGKRLELYIGKPSPIMGKLACDTMDLTPDRCLMVGDSLFTDIGVGKSSGMKTALVLTGISRISDMEDFNYKPDYVLDGIWDIA